MKIEAFLIAYNEEFIGLAVKHYLGFCSKVTVYDNFSTDDTRDRAIEAGAEVKLFGKAHILSDQAYLDIKNHCWKGSDADFVIVADADEILYHPNLLKELEAERHCTIFNTQGWAVYSKNVPKYDYLELTLGHKDEQYSKHVIFSPKLKEINYIFGCHKDRPQGVVTFGSFKPVVLHYRYIGGPERILKRHRMYGEKVLSDENKRWGLGGHYWTADDQKRKEWEESFKKCVPLQEAGIIS